MVRAELFVERAWEAGLLSPTQSRPLLIVGAGAGGATAALHAATILGVSTILADRADAPFKTQADCPTRWLDPSIYDFPVDHWHEGRYPPSMSVAAPHLSWSANWSHIVAMHWRSIFYPLVQTGGLLEFRPHTEIKGVPVLDPSNRFVTVPVLEGQTRKTIECALVLLALGLGTERTFLLDRNQQPGASRGFSFWEQDPLGSRGFSLAHGSNPSILISGAGDGALQDFLRLTTTCTSPDEIYAAAPLDNREIAALHSAQRRAERIIVWGSSARTDHLALSVMHEAVNEVVARKYAVMGDEIRSNLERLVRNPMPAIQMMFECNHFANCYSINQYLVLLIARYASELLGSPVLRPGRRLRRIVGSHGHMCQGDPNHCHGEQHEIEWVTSDDCRTNAGTSNGRENANILIIRHGTYLNPLAEQMLPPLRRHLLPYFLPS